MIQNVPSQHYYDKIEKFLKEGKLYQEYDFESDNDSTLFFNTINNLNGVDACHDSGTFKVVVHYPNYEIFYNIHLIAERILFPDTEE